MRTYSVGPEGAAGGRFPEATGLGEPYLTPWSRRSVGLSLPRGDQAGRALFNPVVPGGAVLCTRQALFKRSGAVPVLLQKQKAAAASASSGEGGERCVRGRACAGSAR